MSSLTEAMREGAEEGGSGAAEALSDADAWEEVRRHARGARRGRTLRGFGALGAGAGAALLAFGGAGAAEPDVGAYALLGPQGAQAPITVAGVDLACGAELAPELPADRVDVASPRDLWIGGEVIVGDQVEVKVSVKGMSADVALAATAVLALDGVVVSSMPVVGSASGVGATLVPGRCVTGEIDSELLATAEAAGAQGRVLETHLAIVALDAAGEVVGHWFDPAGTRESFVPPSPGGASATWCPDLSGDEPATLLS